MVKVISEEPDPRLVRRVTCDSCARILEYSPRDVKTMTDCDGDQWHSIRCPGCKASISVRGVPGSWRDR